MSQTLTLVIPETATYEMSVWYRMTPNLIVFLKKIIAVVNLLCMFLPAARDFIHFFCSAF
jgi:hypothetical protein